MDTLTRHPLLGRRAFGVNSDADAHGHADAHANELGDSHSDFDAHVHANKLGDPHANEHGNSDLDYFGNVNGHGDRHAHGNVNLDGIGHANVLADSILDRLINRNRDRCRPSVSDSDRKPNKTQRMGAP